MTQDIEAKLSHYNEAMEELRIVQAQVKALEKDILREIKESGEIRNDIPFEYAGGYYRATIRIDGTRHLAPLKKEVIEAIRQMMPEDEQTTEKAEAFYESLYSHRPVPDKVSIKAVEKPDDKNAKKSE